MKRNLLILTLLFSCRLWAADYYWVGGAGNWSDLNHWRLGSSGGAIPSIVPSSLDDVFFDANSGFVPGSIRVSLNSNAFCNNMTWGNVQNSPQFVNTSTAFNIQISGNIVLNPTTYYEAMFVFTGSSNATLTSGGTILGQFGMYIDKGAGSLTVVDSLVVPNTTPGGINNTTFASGTFNIAGKKMLVNGFGSQNDNVRTLEMTNSTVICNTTTNSGFKVTGLNKTVNATGSTIVAFGYNTDQGVYKNVTITSASGPNTVFVNNSTITKLIFNAIVGSVNSNIGSNNTVDTIIFNEVGGIGYNYGGGNLRVSNNNTVGYVKFAKWGQLNGTGNVIGKIECLNTFYVNTSSTTNTIDSLILAPNRLTNFWGTLNINKYLYVAGASCEAYTEITGEPTAGTVNFAAGAVVDISNVILTGVHATGPVTPIAVNGIDGGNNTGFTITEPVGTGTTLYWVGGSGDWNEKAHWSFTSGGAGGACVPFKNDSVVFNGSSGLAGGTVTTSSNSFCKGLTWAAGVGATTFNESASYPLWVYGSVTLQSSVTYSAILEIVGTDATTLTTNGGGTGSFSFNVTKTGSGSLTLLDNWINNTTGGNIGYASGGLNMAGRTVTCWVFSSNTSSIRNLDISNATITANLRWIYMGSNKTIISTGSHLTANGLLQINAPNSTYPWIDATTIRQEPNNYAISGSTIGQLTFTNPVATSVAGIASGNTIRRLEYKGAGVIGSTTNNNIDSLILAGSRYYVFGGTNTIYKYIKAEATPCTGLTEMRGATVNTTLAFQPTAAGDIHIANVYMQNMRATGVMTPIAFSGADAGGNTGWTINSAPGSPRYWIGGSGDWNDPNHWSVTSGGAPGACVPTVNDDVFFDAGSGFTAGSKTVTMNNGNAYARNTNWTGALNNPIFNKSGSWSFEVWGDSLILNPATALNMTFLTMKGSNAAFIKGSAPGGNFDFRIDKAGGSVTLLDDYNNTGTTIAVTNGAFNAPNRTLTVDNIDNESFANATSIDISNATITTNSWEYAGTITNHALNAINSVITASNFSANGFGYNKVNVTGTGATIATINNLSIDSLIFTNASTSSAAGINGGSNTFNYVEYKGSGGIYGTANTIDTLVFFPGNRYVLNSGTNTTITGEWYGSGTPCRLTEIVSSTTTNATITKTSGDVTFDYVRLQRITGTGGSTYGTRQHSIDLGGNTGWTIAPYDGAAPIYGLGPDVSTVLANFPMTLRTDGFFGSPSSQYIWNDNSTADTLEITGPGTYSVNVNFPDGCNISDAITVTLSPSLPITLVSFTVRQVECQSRLDWKVADAINFSRFAIEKSSDGYAYSKVADIPYTGVYNYTWTDPAPDIQTSYYRLKLVDADETYTYSNTVSATNNCQVQAIKVYPTVTEGWVKVTMPAGYEQATIQIYNISGQRISPLITGSGTGRTVYLQNFPKATYILQVINGTERKSFTIIKP